VDEVVARSLAKWPDVPAVYGWLLLDRRGNWLIKSTSPKGGFERIGNSALREFIARNYESDAQGRWYFQNGPQRVYVTLAYTPLVVHYEGDRLFDHCARPFSAVRAYQDDEGSVVIEGGGTVALLDDRDLARFADEAQGLSVIECAAVPGRFGFVQAPAPG
jgi:hypothetical protein